MQDKDELLLSPEKNEDIRFIHSKVNKGHTALAYWVSNDDFAEEIRKIKNTNITIDARVIFDIAYDVYNKNVELSKTQSNPDFMFNVFEEGLVSLQTQIFEKNPERIPERIFVPAGNEDMTYLLDVCAELDYRTKVHLVSDKSIVDWFRKYDRVNSVQEAYDTLKILFFKVLRHGNKNSEDIAEINLYFRLRSIVMDFSSTLFGDKYHWHKEYAKYIFEKEADKMKKFYWFSEDTSKQVIFYKNVSGVYGRWLIINDGKPITLITLRPVGAYDEIESINAVLDNESINWENVDAEDINNIREWLETFKLI